MKKAKANRIHKAFSADNRFSITKLLLDNRKMTPEQIKKRLKIEGTLLSHHLSVLKKYGILAVVRKGKNSFYSIKPEVRIRNGIKIGGQRVLF